MSTTAKDQAATLVGCDMLSAIDDHNKQREGLMERLNILKNENLQLLQQQLATEQELQVKKNQLERKIDAIFNDRVEKQYRVYDLRQEYQSKRIRKILIERLKTRIYTFFTDFLNLPQSYRECFKIVEYSKVQYAGQNQNHTQFIYGHKSSYLWSFGFRIKIVQTLEGRIIIGVLNYSTQKNKRISHNDPKNVRCYDGFTGLKYPEQQKQCGGGFKSGDIVQFRFDRDKEVMKYIVNGALIATQHVGKYAFALWNVLPFVELYNTNDSVQLIQGWDEG